MKLLPWTLEGSCLALLFFGTFVAGADLAEHGTSQESTAVAAAHKRLQADSQQLLAAGNPAVDLYRKWAKQYETDAEAAEAAAKMYAKMAQEAVPIAVKSTTGLTASELQRIGVGTWAHATWQFEQMLENPKPGKAAMAAAAAAAPFSKSVNDYAKSELAYDGAAQGYALRVGMDQALAKKLATYANQYRLEGKTEMADAYVTQSRTLAAQAKTFSETSKDYNKMAAKIYGVIPVLQGMAGAAGAFAAYKENPANDMPPEHVFPFTVVPPLEFVQTGAVEARNTDGFLSRFGWR